MRRYRKWVLTLGLMAATPGVTMADGFFSSILKPKDKSAAKQTAGKSENQQVAEQIAGALRGARLTGYDIQIEYKDGVATLQGKVQNATQRAVATRVVEQVAGVKRVDNQMTTLVADAETPAPTNSSPIQQVSAELPAAAPTAGPATSNQAVAEGIARSLAGAGLSGYDVEIRFKNGVAALDGTVATAEQKALASQVVSRINGVQQVANNLSVLQQAPAAPAPGGIQQTAFQAPGGAPAYMPAMAQGAPLQAMPMSMGNHGQQVYHMPHMPNHAWPSYAAYPNFAQVTYPQQYSASAWPYIGPFYPYPQVPLGWRKVQMEWDDGYWNLNFNPRTDRWWWFMNPKNW